MKTLKKILTKRINYFNEFEGEIDRVVLRPYVVLILGVIVITVALYLNHTV